MINKYFTPSIEDIRVGYECDMLNSEGNWQSFKFGDHLYYEGFGVDMEQLRVPYLTKEQIEAEGWKHEWLEKGTHSWSKKELILTTFEDFSRIKINYISGYQLFDGECKDINTFRYICRLLNI